MDSVSGYYQFVCLYIFKAEREQEAEESSLIYADLKAARETIEELEQEKGIDFFFCYKAGLDIALLFVACHIDLSSASLFREL